MFKSIKPIMMAGIVILSINGVGPGISVHASVAAGTENKNEISKIQDLDEYVSVVDNKFELKVPDNINVSKEIMQEAEVAIKKSNDLANNNHLTIDKNSKVIEDNSPTTRAAWHSYYTYKNFWWGIRYYFTSNSAVNMLAHEWENTAAILALGGIAGTYLSAGSSIMILGVGSWYFTNTASQLRYYNSMHLKNQIYMDVNYALQYDFHILR